MQRKRFLVFILLIALTIGYLILELMYINSRFDKNYIKAINHQRNNAMEKYCRLSLTEMHTISCERIIRGDRDYVKTLSHLSKRRPRQSCNELVLEHNCDNLISLHRYHSKRNLSDEELTFPLAFALKVHKDPIQVEQLLRAIYRPHNVYCIHVDLKAEKAVVRVLQHVASCLPNVFVIQEVNVVYASIGLLKSDLVCMEELVKTKVKWRYYINLSGQEFPLKTNLEIVQILKSLHGKNDIESYPFPKVLYNRFKRRWTIRRDAIIRLNIKKLPFKHRIDYHKGSMYGMFTRKFVDFVLTNAISKELIVWANDTFAPEEMVWATLNSFPGAPGGYNITVSHGKNQFVSREMIWMWNNNTCHGIFVHGVCIFSYEDLPWLVSSPKVIANKFNSDFDQLAIDCLEDWLYKKTVIGTTANLNWFYYQNVPHVKMTE